MSKREITEEELARESFLIRARGTRNSAHAWDGRDTACRMWTTGGMNQHRRYDVHTGTNGHPVCTMCAQNKGWLLPKAESPRDGGLGLLLI